MIRSVADLVAFLDSFAPARLAESWDNVGLLVGDAANHVQRVMTCLTITPASAAEAVAEQADLIVTHHPLPFHPLKRLTTDTVEGRLLWNLIRAGASIYSPHTAFDSARQGINQRLADGLGLLDPAPLVPIAESSDTATSGLGAGRWGVLAKAEPLDTFAQRVKQLLKIDQVQVVGPAERMVSKIAVACGSAGEFLGVARQLGCDCLLTGETRFHTCLEAEATDTALVLAGHYASERFGVEALAEVLSRQFADLHIWPSRRECDPLRWC